MEGEPGAVGRAPASRAEGRSETLRPTIPQVVVPILDLQKGDEMTWIVDSSTRQVIVVKAESKRASPRQ